MKRKGGTRDDEREAGDDNSKQYSYYVMFNINIFVYIIHNISKIICYVTNIYNNNNDNNVYISSSKTNEIREHSRRS